MSSSIAPECIGQIVLQLTGTKLQDRLTWVRLLKDVPSTQTQPAYWLVRQHDQHEYALSVQPRALFTLDGRDLLTGQPVQGHLRDLINQYLISQGREPLE